MCSEQAYQNLSQIDGIQYTHQLPFENKIDMSVSISIGYDDISSEIC